MNYFELYNINNSFDVNKDLIEDRYIELQRSYQPDRASDEQERMSFIKILADVNNGYKTLKDDYLRAVYLLKLQKIDLSNDHDLRNKMPFEILSDILLKREEAEKLRGIEELELAKTHATSERNEILRKIGESLKSGENEGAIIKIMHLKYQDNLINIIDKKIEECF